MTPSSTSDHVLVVDDDASFAQLLATWLSQLGLTCETFHTGEEALKRVAVETPRAVIVDGLLPGIRGDEVVRRLRLTHPAERLPIVFISAFFRDLRSYSYLTKECGVNAVVHKPVTQEELLPTLRRVLGLKAPDPAIEIQVEPMEQLLSGEVDELLPEYLGTCRERVAAMRTSLMALGGQAEHEAREVLQIESHRLRGSGACFGLPEISRVARQIEEMVADRDPSPLSVGERSRLAGFVEGMTAVVAKAAGDRVIATERAELLARIWLIDAHDSELAVACASVPGGGPVEVFSDVGTALDSLDRAPQAAAGAALALALADRPDTVFIAADRWEIDARAAATRLIAAGIGPLLFVTRDASLTSRLDALAAGATGIVPRLADGGSLVRVAREFSPLAPGFTALAIACPQKALEALAQPLAARGIALQPCMDIEHVVEAIDAQAPALLVIGDSTGAMSGPALVRALRTEPAILELPVVAFAGTHAQPEEMLEAGAEDWVSPAMPLEAIARRLEIHARRHLRQLRDLSRDPLTGAVRRPVLLEELERGLALARRSGRSLGLLLFAFDAPGLAERRGRFALLEVVSGVGALLRASFRSSDVVARIEEGRFAVLLQEAGADDARRLLSKQLEALSQRRFGADPGRFAVAFQGGWAGFPEVPGGPQALLDAAEASLLG